MASGHDDDDDSGSEEVLYCDHMPPSANQKTGTPTSCSSASPGDTAAPWITTSVLPPLTPEEVAALREPLPSPAQARKLRAKRKAERKERREAIVERTKASMINGLNLEVSSPATATAARLISARCQSQTHAAASMFPAAASHTGISQADHVNQAQASCFLERRDYARWWKPYPRGPCRTDITNGRFDWRSFVTGRSWYRTHIKIFKGEGVGITRFEVAWHNRLYLSVFLGTRADGQKFMVNPRARPWQPELSWITGDIDEMFPAEV